MAKATYRGAVIAESDAVEVVEGNLYFPRSSVNMQYCQPSAQTSVCGWKGTANYFDIEVAGDRIENGAWYYPETKDRAKHIEGYVAFWNGVAVEP